MADSLKVLLFGPEADLAGAAFVVIDAPDEPGADAIKTGVERAAPALRGKIGHCRVACNGEFASADVIARADDEIALIGLVSGG